MRPLHAQHGQVVDSRKHLLRHFETSYTIFRPFDPTVCTIHSSHILIDIRWLYPLGAKSYDNALHMSWLTCYLSHAMCDIALQVRNFCHQKYEASAIQFIYVTHALTTCLIFPFERLSYPRAENFLPIPRYSTDEHFQEHAERHS